MEIPAFAKGELKIHIKPFKMNVFGERINEPDTVYFLSLPQYPKDSLIIDLKEAVERGEILTEPIQEDKTLYPEAIELRPSDYIVALIKIGTLTYTDEVIQVYAKNLKDRAQTGDNIDDPRKFQRQRATLLTKLKATVDKFDLDRVYYLRHKVITRGGIRPQALGLRLAARSRRPPTRPHYCGGGRDQTILLYRKGSSLHQRPC